jgi:hypothetical protein
LALDRENRKTFARFTHLTVKMRIVRKSLSLSFCCAVAALVIACGVDDAFAATFAAPRAATQPGPGAAPAAAEAKLIYRRVFKGSTPEFIEIVVRQNSEQATYDIRQLDEDAEALPFEISSGLRAKMFDYATQLNHFQGQDLDVHRKIANLGEKTFRWEQGSEVHETKFNYTLNSSANQLLQIFEGLARQEENVMLILRRMKYDRLGVNDALLQFESDLNRSLLPEPQRALPMLDQIASDPKFVDIARQRARNLADRIRHQG